MSEALPTLGTVNDETVTARLLLRRPVEDDVDAIFAISSDPRVWTHFPSLRHTERSTTETMVLRWIAGWDAVGTGTWVVCLRSTGEVIGNGGCALIGEPGGAGTVWNLGYRLAAEHHGKGYATELSAAAIAAARAAHPEVPVTAYLVAHNRASAAVAEKAGLDLVMTTADPGNPDPGVTRLVYADRPLTDAQRERLRR